MSIRIKNFLTYLRKDQNKDRQYVREKTCDSLYEIFLSVYDYGGQHRYLDDERAKSFGIIVKDMELDSNGEYTMRAGEEFFKPLRRELLEAAPIDESDEEIRRHFTWFHEWPEEVRRLENGGCGSIAMDLRYKLGQLVHYYRRIGPGENAKRVKLMKLTGWRDLGLCPDIVNEVYMGMLKFGGSVSQDCRIDQSYFSAHRREEEPHVIIMLEHFYEGNENISRAEVLVALAAMVTQMEHDYLESHCIAPVLVVSFMESFQGRIMQAHATEDGLLIQKTKLHSFRTQDEFDQSMPFFVRYTASDRVGDTKQRVLLDLPREVQEPADVKQVRDSMGNLSWTSPTDKVEGKAPMKSAERPLNRDNVS
ncbi:hypothetical protein DTO169C6_4838 [Paecilomyces variotii]|nr:hypothetical protein DTO169C6_4838 [Paecilomyces variotii]